MKETTESQLTTGQGLPSPFCSAREGASGVTLHTYCQSCGCYLKGLVANPYCDACEAAMKRPLSGLVLGAKAHRRGYKKFKAKEREHEAVPEGFSLYFECSITPGDLIEDEDGRWRGPVPHGHEMVGRISSSIFWKPRICKPNT